MELWRLDLASKALELMVNPHAPQFSDSAQLRQFLEKLPLFVFVEKFRVWDRFSGKVVRLVCKPRNSVFELPGPGKLAGQQNVRLVRDRIKQTMFTVTARATEAMQQQHKMLDGPGFKLHSVAKGTNLIAAADKDSEGGEDPLVEDDSDVVSGEYQAASESVFRNPAEVIAELRPLSAEKLPRVL